MTATQRAALEAAREALRFYADEWLVRAAGQTADGIEMDTSGRPTTALSNDYGQRARAALAQIDASLAAPADETLETTEDVLADLRAAETEYPTPDDIGYVPVGPETLKGLLRDFDRLRARLRPVEDEECRYVLSVLAQQIPSPTFEKRLRYLIDRLWRGKGEAEWRTMDSAPKDGRKVLLWATNFAPEGTLITTAWYDTERQRWSGSGLSSHWTERLWMDLAPFAEAAQAATPKAAKEE